MAKNPRDSVSLDNLDELDLIRGAKTLSNVLPKGTPLAAGLEYYEGQLTSEYEQQALKEAGIDLKQARVFSKHARKKLARLENRSTDNLIKFGVQAAGGLGGGTLGAILIGGMTLPFAGLIGGLAGAAGGGYLAGRIYEGNFEKTEQDAVNLAASCYCKVRDHNPINREVALAQLIATLDERDQGKYEDILERKAGTRDFAEATQTREGRNALLSMMSDPHLEDILRGSVHISSNGQHIADQYADLVNKRVLDARAIILNPDNVKRIADRYYMQHALDDNMLAQDDNILPQQLPGGRINGKILS